MNNELNKHPCKSDSRRMRQRITIVTMIFMEFNNYFQPEWTWFYIVWQNSGTFFERHVLSPISLPILLNCKFNAHPKHQYCLVRLTHNCCQRTLDFIFINTTVFCYHFYTAVQSVKRNPIIVLVGSWQSVQTLILFERFRRFHYSLCNVFGKQLYSI